MDETLGLGPAQHSRAPSTSKIINLDDIFSLNSSKKQQISRSKIFTETPTITKEILSNIPTFRGDEIPKPEADLPIPFPSSRLDHTPINNANSVHRINSYLDKEGYSWDGTPKNYANMIPNQQQLSPIKEPMVSSASAGGNVSLFEDIALTYDLQKEVDHCSAYGKIKLPNGVVKVQGLRIVKPVSIIGSSNSSIEVENGIQIDLTSFKKTGKGVVFSECRIFFEYSNRKNFHSHQLISTKSIIFIEKAKITMEIGLDRSEYFQTNERKSYSETMNNNQSHVQMTTDVILKQQYTSRGNIDHKIYPLFCISQNSCLEIRDCSITSKNFEAQNLQDVCFYLKGLNTSEPQLWNREAQPTLYIQSTMIRGFFAPIHSAQMGRIVLDKVFISDSVSHAIDISNPFVFEMKECVIENSKKSCINLRFSRGFQGLERVDRRIMIKQSEFKKVKSYGISIFGDNMTTFQNCQVEICENKILSCAKDGIGIKNLNIKGVIIEKNEISGSLGNGIYLQNILDIASFSQVLIKGNKIMKSQLYGMVIMNAGCYSETNEVTQNMKGGILISDGGEKEYNEEFYKQYALRNIFNCDNIHQNNDSGVIIIGNGKGPIIFNACQLQGNATNGLYIKQDSEVPTLSTKTTSTEEPKSSRREGETNRDILLDKCNIYENLMSGVYVKSLIHPLYSKETMIYGNNSFAVYIQRAEDKGKVIFKGEAKKSKIKEYVSGQVGGAWGLMNDRAPPASGSSICRRPACNIF